ncbi:glycosyltransferase [Clostridium psychrophilum]|uniref:glycosyltransferase n=1 Tax=Clostridium psychrophilum TaxID=132926 RepID=UPI001C0C6471|nr:glycosyltransferase [Clostridium psychrophilum]MBU3180278.1 glycosyltransferase [Clostridium psychrophilum]
MKKIVYVVESFGSGVYTFLSELCNSITREYEVVIVYSLRRETPLDFKKNFDSKIRFINVSMYRGLNPIKSLKALGKLKRVFKKENPEIIHLNSSIAGFLGRIACYANRFNMDKVFYNPHGFSFLQKNESRIKRTIFYGLERFASMLGGYTVGCSFGEYKEALKISKKCININNGIDPKKIDEIIKENNLNVNKNNNNNKLKVGTVGRICYQKNPKLFNDIAKKFPQYDFIWVGYGELKDRLQADNIKVTGWSDRKEVIKEIMNIDIFIMTSLWEGLSISLLEAMYLGKPVIVSNVIGNNDVIKNNVNGYLVNDLKEYIKIINYITSNNIISDVKFKEKVRENVIEEYGLNQMVRKYINLYEAT